MEKTRRRRSGRSASSRFSTAFAIRYPLTTTARRARLLDPDVEPEGLDEPIETLGGDALGDPDPDRLSRVVPQSRRSIRTSRRAGGVSTGDGAVARGRKRGSGRRARRRLGRGPLGAEELVVAEGPGESGRLEECLRGRLLGRGDDLVVMVEDVAENGGLGQASCRRTARRGRRRAAARATPGGRAGGPRPGRPGGGSTGPAG